MENRFGIIVLLILTLLSLTLTGYSLEYIIQVGLNCNNISQTYTFTNKLDIIVKIPKQCVNKNIKVYIDPLSNLCICDIESPGGRIELINYLLKYVVFKSSSNYIILRLCKCYKLNPVIQIVKGYELKVTYSPGNHTISFIENLVIKNRILKYFYADIFILSEPLNKLLLPEKQTYVLNESIIDVKFQDFVLKLKLIHLRTFLRKIWIKTNSTINVKVVTYYLLNDTKFVIENSNVIYFNSILSIFNTSKLRVCLNYPKVCSNVLILYDGNFSRNCIDIDYFSRKEIYVLLNGEVQFTYKIESVLDQNLTIELPLAQLNKLKVYDLNKEEIHDYKLSICSKENGVEICKNITIGTCIPIGVYNLLIQINNKIFRIEDVKLSNSEILIKLPVKKISINVFSKSCKLDNWYVIIKSLNNSIITKRQLRKYLEFAIPITYGSIILELYKDNTRVYKKVLDLLSTGKIVLNFTIENVIFSVHDLLYQDIKNVKIYVNDSLTCLSNINCCTLIGKAYLTISLDNKSNYTYYVNLVNKSKIDVMIPTLSYISIVLLTLTTSFVLLLSTLLIYRKFIRKSKSEEEIIIIK